ncbi:hypothetical protein AAFP35_08265 [Gordonia sp. CPCC 206044]|uniref:hypothetical protein n=1 Tax=Gordonia sp. CPCC 206044 TaxID=3140793 RepID=UPI003AF3D9E4
MTDGSVYNDVKTTLADQVEYSKTRQKHNWPSIQDDPSLFINFLAYAAAKRLGYFGGTWDEFCNQCAAVGEAGEEELDPTQRTTSDA